MPDRKAQAAMEFLMTYGWAILVVLVVIGALAYFGVLSPATLLPEKCAFTVPLNCVDFSVGDESVSVVLQNGAGKDMKVTNIAFFSDALSGVCDSGAIDATLRNGEKAAFFANEPAGCSFVDSGRSKNRYHVDVTYSWLDSGIGHVLEGELLARHDAGVVAGGQGSFGGGGGLAGYWKFDALDSGKVVADSSGNGNDGVFTGSTNDATASGAAIAVGKYGNGAEFDGMDDYLDGNEMFGFERNNPFSVSLWFRRGVKSDNFHGLVGKMTSTGNGQGWLVSIPAANTLRFQLRSINGDPNSISISADTLSIPLNTWQHWAVTYDGSSSASGVKVYQNGVSKTTSTQYDALVSSILTTASFNIGARDDGIGPASGAIDEMRLYDRALTQSEITQSMNSQYPVPTPAASYSFENSGSTGSDTHFLVENNGRKAISLNGADTYVSIPDSASLDISNAITVSLWVNIPSHKYNNDVLNKGVSYDGAGGQNSGYLISFDGSGKANYQLGILNDWLNVNGQITLSTNTWHHVVLTYDGIAVKGYVDGSPDNSWAKSGTIGTNNENLIIGGRPSWGQVFNGMVSGVIIYDRALSEGEIAALAGQ